MYGFIKKFVKVGKNRLFGVLGPTAGPGWGHIWPKYRFFKMSLNFPKNVYLINFRWFERGRVLGRPQEACVNGHLEEVRFLQFLKV